MAPKQAQLSREEQLKRYQQAGQVCNEAIRLAKSLSKPSVAVTSVCEQVNEFIEKKGASLAFPCSLSIDSILCHFAPGQGDADMLIEDKNVCKVEVGVHVDGCSALSAATFVVGDGDGCRRQIIAAAEQSTKALIERLKVGENNRSVVGALREQLPASYSFVQGMMSHRLEPSLLSTDDIIVLNPVEGQMKTVGKVDFEEGQVWALDVALTSGANGAIRPHPHHRTTIYARTGKSAPLRLQSSRAIYSAANQSFGNFCFSLDQLAGLARDGRVKMALQEFLAKGLIMPYEVLQPVEADALAARFLATCVIRNGQAVLLTDPFEA